LREIPRGNAPYCKEDANTPVMMVLREGKTRSRAEAPACHLPGGGQQESGPGQRSARSGMNSLIADNEELSLPQQREATQKVNESAPGCNRDGDP
jgi:hypothetical protein